MDFNTFISKKIAKSLRTEELFDEDILRIACQQHLDQTIAGFAMGGARNLAKMKPRWYSLLESALVTRTSEEALAAWREAVHAGQSKTRTFLEAGNTSRMIVVTSAPWLDESRFLRSLPGRSYVSFIKPYRQSFHGVTDWEKREFAHWVFTVGEDDQGYQDISVSLFYLESFDSFVSTAMMQLQQNPGHLVRFEGAMIVPTTYLPGNSADALFTEMLRCDAGVKLGRST